MRDRKFILMFMIILLLSMNCHILRSVRNTLTVVDLGSGAHMIPYFELFGSLPAGILLTIGLTFMLNRFSMKHVFSITMGLFVAFFLSFSCIFYPMLALARESPLILSLASMLFHIFAELWKPALLVILFWGLLNALIPLEEAKKLYPPLILGASLGSLMSGTVVTACTSETLWNFCSLGMEKWEHAFTLMMLLISFFGLLTTLLYRNLYQILSVKKIEGPKESLLLKESIGFFLRNRNLKILAWIVIADYIAYSLGEVIFLDILKRKFPDACSYCSYMGTLSFYSGALTIISALFVTPFILQSYGWTMAALVTPLCLLITESAFFLFLRGGTAGEVWFQWDESVWIGTVVFLGSLQYCICRAAKLTLFDSTKELAYVHMSTYEKMRGKLVIDGIAARAGRAGSSFLNILLINSMGSVIGGSFVAGILAIGVTLSWIKSVSKLGRLFGYSQAV